MKRFRSVLLKVILPLCICSTLTGAAFLKVTLKNTDPADPLVDLGVIISVGGSYLPGDFDSMNEEETATDGETVVTAGVRFLTDGQKVKEADKTSEYNVGGLL